MQGNVHMEVQVYCIFYNSRTCFSCTHSMTDKGNLHNGGGRLRFPLGLEFSRGSEYQFQLKKG